MEIIENKLGAAVAYRSLTVWQEFSENRGIIKERSMTAYQMISLK